jgi:hypothetical protein
MKINTFKKYPFTADIYKVVNEDVAGAPVYAFDKTIKCAVFFDNTGRMVIHYPQTLRIGNRIENVRDKGGALVTVGNKNYYINDYEAIMNPFGYIDSVRYNASSSRSF